MQIDNDQDLIIDIPLDGISIDHDDAASAKPTKPVLPTGGARPSALAKAAGKPDADRISALERERDEAARVAAEARTRATQLEEVARVAAEGRVKAEETAERRTREAMGSHWAKLHADKAQIEGAIAATQAEANAAERDLVAAAEAADAVKQAAAQRALAKAEAVLAKLEDGRLAADAQIDETRRLYEERQRHAREPKPEPKPEPPKKAEAEPEAPRTADEWIDKTARTALGEDGAAWLREHKEFVTDAKLNRKLLRFADDYVDDHGPAALKSAEFRAALNERFFPKADEGDDMSANDDGEVDLAEEPAPPAKRTAPSAPVSRSSPARPQSGNGKIRLSPDEQSIAAQMYPDLDRNAALKKYASNKARAIADGHYNR